MFVKGMSVHEQEGKDPDPGSSGLRKDFLPVGGETGLGLFGDPGCPFLQS